MRAYFLCSPLNDNKEWTYGTRFLLSISEASAKRYSMVKRQVIHQQEFHPILSYLDCGVIHLMR